MGGGRSDGKVRDCDVERREFDAIERSQGLLAIPGNCDMRIIIGHDTWRPIHLLQLDHLTALGLGDVVEPFRDGLIHITELAQARNECVTHRLQTGWDGGMPEVIRARGSSTVHRDVAVGVIMEKLHGSLLERAHNLILVLAQEQRHVQRDMRNGAREIQVVVRKELRHER